MPLNTLAFLDRATVGDCIRYYRWRTDVNQADLATRIGITQSMLSRIELNQRRASPELLEAIAAELSIDLSELVPREPMARAG